MKLFLCTVCACAALGFASTAQAGSIFADTVLEYSESAAGIGGPGTNPNGGGGGLAQNAEVPLSHVTDGNSSTFISLPTGTFVSLGFSTGFITDGTGNDLFIDEIGNGGEDADIFVSEDFGSTFVFLAKALGNQTNHYDFANFSTELASFGSEIKVNAVKVVGLDNGGSAPGFDLTFVEGLDGSVVEEPQGPPAVPLPAGLPLALSAFAAFGIVRSRRKS